jgi:hypothetical protein
MFYRQNIPINQQNLVSIKNYVKQKFGDIQIKVIKENKKKKELVSYNFDDVMDYYEERDENFIVGIIDKNLNKLAYSDNDLFKIREPRAKKLDKKRGTGIPTLKGSTCTTKEKGYLINLIKKLPNISKEEIEKTKTLSREILCNTLKEKLLYLEKYSTTKDKNKMTYVMIPIDHPEYEFPYNLEDRVKYKINEINKLAGRKVDVDVKKNKLEYELTFKNDKFIDPVKKDIEKLGFNLNKNEWLLEIK